MKTDDDKLTAASHQLLNRSLTGPPDDLLRPFLSLGGADGQAVYSTSFTVDAKTTWWVLAVVGRGVIHIKATGPESWDARDDEVGTLDAYTAAIEASVESVSVEETWPLHPARFGRVPLSPWATSWLIKLRNGGSWSIPAVDDHEDQTQCDNADRVADAIRTVLTGS